jgi:hypothetical protein
MEDPKINEIISKTLNEFDLMEQLQPSAGWNESLMDRLGRSAPVSSSRMPRAAIVAVMVMIVLNLAIFISQLKTSRGGPDGRDAEYRIISHELLSNPVSLRD